MRMIKTRDNRWGEQCSFRYMEYQELPSETPLGPRDGDAAKLAKPGRPAALDWDLLMAPKRQNANFAVNTYLVNHTEERTVR